MFAWLFGLGYWYFGVAFVIFVMRVGDGFVILGGLVVNSVVMLLLLPVGVDICL